MGQEQVLVPCPECGISGESDPASSRWQCINCGNGFFLRRCSACARVSYVDGLQGIRVPWPCTWCGRFNGGFSQNRDPAAASAAELVAEVAGPGPPPGGPGPEAGNRARLVPGTGEGSGASPAPEPGNRGWSPAAGTGSPDAAPPLPGPAAAPSGRRVLRIGLSLAAAVACAVAAAVLLSAGGPRAAGMATGQGGSTRAVQVTVGHVGTVDFRGVPGQLAIAGLASGPVTLTGQLHGASAQTRFDHATGVLAVSVRCAPATRCTQNLRLAVPAETSADVRQPGGRIVVTGVAGPLRITAANVDISASGLRSAALAVAITRGHLSATFAAPPQRASITLASAQATLRLPARSAYRVTQEVTSGYVRVGVPQAASATRTVTARIDSGELELLPY